MNRRRRHVDAAASVPVPFHTRLRQAWRRQVQDERMLQQALLEICSGCTSVMVELGRGAPSTSAAAGVSHLRNHDHMAKRIWRAAAGIGRRDYVFWSAAYPPRPESVHDVKKTGFLLCPRGSFHRHVKLQECLSEDTIRPAAQRLLQVLPKQLPRPAKPLAERPARIRIMTYNIHICLGMDGRISPRRIARVIAEHHPDVVCLQEVDVASARTGGHNQPRIIAEELGMEMLFNPVRECNGELYGDAILSHLPMRLIKKAFLPGHSPDRRVEQRGAIWVQLDVHGAALQVINTHLGLRGWEKKLQVETLLGEEWLSNPGIETPIIFCGDFNITPRSFLYTQIADVLQDAQDVAESAHSTWFTHWPVLRLDHVFASDDLKILDVKVPRNALAKVASDHLPLIADVEFWVNPE